jgi:hypothetical protein
MTAGPGNPPHSEPEPEKGSSADQGKAGPLRAKDEAGSPVHDREILPAAEVIKNLAEAHGWAGSRPYNQTPNVYTSLYRKGEAVVLPTHFRNATELRTLLEILEIPAEDWPKNL